MRCVVAVYYSCVEFISLRYNSVWIVTLRGFVTFYLSWVTPRFSSFRRNDLSKDYCENLAYFALLQTVILFGETQLENVLLILELYAFMDL